MIVYMLYHSRDLDDLENNLKLIGIYTSEEKAKNAIERVGGQPGFRDFPNGFQIYRQTLDEDSWAEGFITTDEAEEPYS
jgi:hypothetical protein